MVLIPIGEVVLDGRDEAYYRPGRGGGVRTVWTLLAVSTYGEERVIVLLPSDWFGWLMANWGQSQQGLSDSMAEVVRRAIHLGDRYYEVVRRHERCERQWIKWEEGGLRGMITQGGERA